MSGLYRRVLGEAFDALPPVLRDFHDLAHGGQADGQLRVTWGSGVLHRLLAAALRLPAEGDRVPLQLRVIVQGDREVWQRQFGRQMFQTVQWMRHGLLIEGIGPFRCGYRVLARTDGMQLDCVRTWLLGVPVPRALPLYIHAEVLASEQSWRVHVQVSAPFLGSLLSYEGEITPQ